jgi:hypothetical protein
MPFYCFCFAPFYHGSNTKKTKSVEHHPILVPVLNLRLQGQTTVIVIVLVYGRRADKLATCSKLAKCLLLLALLTVLNN